MIWNGSAGVPV